MKLRERWMPLLGTALLVILCTALPFLWFALRDRQLGASSWSTEMASDFLSAAGRENAVARELYYWRQQSAEAVMPQPAVLSTAQEAVAPCLDALRSGFRDGVRYDDLYQRLLFGAGGSPADEYFLLADFAAYCQAEQRMVETYRDQTVWNRMSLHNIARSGVFAADRAVAEYADHIWHVPHK